MSRQEEETNAPRRAGPFAEPWLLCAAACAVGAAVCLVLGFYDAAFVAAALGAVAWFLNVRAKLPRPPERVAEDADDEALPEEDEAGDGQCP